jgi:hypothetical protein
MKQYTSIAISSAALVVAIIALCRTTPVVPRDDTVIMNLIDGVRDEARMYNTNLKKHDEFTDKRISVIEERESERVLEMTRKAIKASSNNDN